MYMYVRPLKTFLAYFCTPNFYRAKSTLRAYFLQFFQGLKITLPVVCIIMKELCQWFSHFLVQGHFSVLKNSRGHRR